MHTREKNILSKIQIEVDSAMATVEIRVQDAVLTAIENSVNRRVELAIKSANASAGRIADGNKLKPGQRGF